MATFKALLCGHHSEQAYLFSVAPPLKKSTGHSSRMAQPTEEEFVQLQLAFRKLIYGLSQDEPYQHRPALFGTCQSVQGEYGQFLQPALSEQSGIPSARLAEISAAAAPSDGREPALVWYVGSEVRQRCCSIPT